MLHAKVAATHFHFLNVFFLNPWHCLCDLSVPDKVMLWIITDVMIDLVEATPQLSQ
jgi:hypothetical protein